VGYLIEKQEILFDMFVTRQVYISK